MGIMMLRLAQVAVVTLAILFGGCERGLAERTDTIRKMPISELQAAVTEVQVVRTTANHVGTGTGFFVSSNGRILTNWHVIRDAAKITVRTMQGETLTGVVVAEDRDRDLAVIQVPGDNFPSLELTESDHMVPGIAITLITSVAQQIRPGHTGTMREICGYPMLQISTPLQPGCSGSPLVDAQGRVVGIADGQIVGATPDKDEHFAVPVLPIRQLLAQTPIVATVRP